MKPGKKKSGSAEKADAATDELDGEVSGPPACGSKSSPSGPCPTHFIVEAPNRILLAQSGRYVTLVAKDLPGVKPGKFKWDTDSEKIQLVVSGDKCVVYPADDLDVPNDVSKERDAEVITVTREARHGCKELSDKVRVTVARLAFSKSKFNKYGYDDYDQKGPWREGSPLHHLSIRNDRDSYVHVKIEGGLERSDFNFTCDQGTKRPCTVEAHGDGSEFELRVIAGEAHTAKQILSASLKTDPKLVFGKLALVVYELRQVNVVVGKFDKLRGSVRGVERDLPLHPILNSFNAALHTVDVNIKMIEAVVVFDIRNLYTDNSIAHCQFKSGGSILKYDINTDNGGEDVELIMEIMAGRKELAGAAQRTRLPKNAVRVIVVSDFFSYYYLDSTSETRGQETVLKIHGGVHCFIEGMKTQIGPLEGEREQLEITKVETGIIYCKKLRKNYPRGTHIEYAALGWSGNPAIVKVRTTAADMTEDLWSVAHEVCHTKFNLHDVDDKTNLMHHDASNTDHKVRHKPLKHHRDEGTKEDTDCQWDMMHKG